MMGRKKKYIEMFCSFTEPFKCSVINLFLLVGACMVGNLFAVFQSFEQNRSCSQQRQFVIGSQLTTEHASAPRAYTTHARCKATAVKTSSTERRSANRENPRCDICNREFNSNVQALSHFRGMAHNEEVIRRANGMVTLHHMKNSK